MQDWLAVRGLVSWCLPCTTFSCCHINHWTDGLQTLSCEHQLANHDLGARMYSALLSALEQGAKKVSHYKLAAATYL